MGLSADEKEWEAQRERVGSLRLGAGLWLLVGSALTSLAQRALSLVGIGFLGVPLTLIALSLGRRLSGAIERGSGTAAGDPRRAGEPKPAYSDLRTGQKSEPISRTERHARC